MGLLAVRLHPGHGPASGGSIAPSRSGLRKTLNGSGEHLDHVHLVIGNRVDDEGGSAGVLIDLQPGLSSMILASHPPVPA